MDRSLNGESSRKKLQKKINSIMVGYANNHTRETYKLYDRETKIFLMTRDVKWADWKMTNSAETLKMFSERQINNIRC